MASESGTRPTRPGHPPSATTGPPRELQLFLLDGFRLVHRGVPVTVPRGLQRVVALVGLRSGATRSHLAGLLWPDRPEQRALSSLRTALWRLRRHPYCPVLIRDDSIHLDPLVRLDVDDLIRAAAYVQRAGDPRRVTGILTAGRHDLLPGWYDDWVLLERERLRQLRLHALEEVARAHLRAGRHAEALQAALEAMRAEPLRETPHRLIVEIHLAEGNAYEALHAFYAYRELTLRDLQLEPSPAMRELLEHILTPIGEPAARPPQPAPGTPPTQAPPGQPPYGQTPQAQAPHGHAPAP